MMSANLETIKSLYESFDRADIPAVLSALAEDIEWNLFGDPASNPVCGSYRGRADVGRFFTTLAENLVSMSLVRELWVEGGESVVASGTFRATVRASGASLETNWAHIWIFNAQGQPARFLDFVDTEAFSRALGGHITAEAAGL